MKDWLPIPREIISYQRIQAHCKKVAKALHQKYSSLVSVSSPLQVIIILKGAMWFASDLLKNFLPEFPVEKKTMRASSYYGKTKPQGEPQLFDTVEAGITGNHTLVIDDILDTGKTVQKIEQVLLKAKPASLSFAFLLNKETDRRIYTPKEIFSTLTIPDIFVVGYGLDYLEFYRNLPYIGVLTKEQVEEIHQKLKIKA